MRNNILVGNVLDELDKIPSKSVHCIITSPPYWHLRKYDVPDVRVINDFHGQLGQESSPDEFVEHLVDIFGAMKRVLRKDGTLWVNIGDSYQDKSLCMVPFKFAVAMGQWGWYVRNDHIYSKNSPMPSSVKDRFARSHEYIFMFTKSDKYYYDWFNGREPAETEGLMRNRRTVMTLEHGRYQGGHFASFGPGLVEPLIAVSTSDYGCCVNCGTPYIRVYDKETVWRGRSYYAKYRSVNGQPDQGKLGAKLVHRGWERGCKCDTEEYKPCVVLDPFMGTGTTALTAQNMGRHWLGIELSQEYTDQAMKRLGVTLL